MAIYYFNASLNTVSGIPDDPNSSWNDDAWGFDGGISNNTSSDALLGSTASKFLYGKGTNAPPTGLAIISVRYRVGFASAGVSTTLGVAIYTAALAEILASRTHGFISLSNTGFFELATPSGGWTWAKVQALEVKIYDAVGDGTFSAKFSIIEIEVMSDSGPASINRTFEVGNGMSRSEMAN